MSASIWNPLGLMNEPGLYRVIDASLNRAAEGLRVVEDYARFVLDDAFLTRQVKELRHDLAAAALAAAVERYAARDTTRDVGTAINTAAEGRRGDAWDVCQASLERTKQSLRSLEEFGKVIGSDLGAAFEALRYRVYTLEAGLCRTVDAVRRLADVHLMALIDGGDSESDFVALASDLVEAGIDVIQLRDKNRSVRQLVERARLLCRVTRSSDHTLAIINDRPAVAAAVGADGVHLGQDDLTVKDARAVLGPRKLIGVSTHSLEQAHQAVLDGASYIGMGPTFPSTTKQFSAYPGLELVRNVSREIRLPAFAIGGINAANVDQVLAAGATRIAVSSAVTSAVSPAAAARDLLAALASGR